MAILLEEEKRPVNWIGITAGVIIVALLFAGGYYVFFSNPGVIDQVAPATLQNVSQLSNTSIDPTSILNLPTFKLLQDYSTPSSLPPAGRSNPFRP
ncbi:MAG: hypothetical protein Q7R98_03675 [Candidatus Jorgensenbacteria bacterium]|nr:hypothetical protein [Candidatus Jorgensenbacteria bacterium]